MWRCLPIFIFFGFISQAKCVWEYSGVNGCTQDCFYSRTNKCGKNICSSGAIFEQFSNCPYPNACPGGMQEVSVIESCSGSCDRSAEKVLFRCSSDQRCSVNQTRFCQFLPTCRGSWGAWGAYGACSSTCGGNRFRTRRCFSKSDPTRPSVDCAGSKGLNEEAQSVACPSCPVGGNNPTPTSSAIPTTTKKKRSGFNSWLVCINDCGHTHKNINLDTLYGACDGSGTSCNRTERYVVFCNGSLSFNARSCGLPGHELHCTNYLPYEQWSAWKTSTTTPSKQNRYRHQWCFLPVLGQPTEGCRQEVRVEKQCRETVSPESLSGTDWLTWLIAFLLVIAFLIFIVVVCVLKRRHSKRKKRKGMESGQSDSLPPVEMKSFGEEDTVFESESAAQNANHAQRRKSKEARGEDAVTPSNLTVMQRIRVASEHLYESISGHGTRLFSRSSVATQPGEERRLESGEQNAGAAKPSSSNQAKGNEYIVDEGVPPKKSENTLRAKRLHPFRISVTITDPEGVQVGNSVYKAKMATTDQFADESEGSDKKKRWSRVPTPRDQTNEQKFFQKDVDQNPHVPSVKYVTAGKNDRTNDQGTSAEKSPKQPRFAIRAFLKKLAGSPKEKSHQYDSVPKEELDANGETQTRRIFLQSASGSAMGLDDDNASMWSGNTFDGSTFSDDEMAGMDSVRYKTPRKTKTPRHHRRKTRSAENLSTGNKENVGLAPHHAVSSRSMEFPSPPTGPLTPSGDVQSPVTARWPEPSRHEQGINSLTVASPNPGGYTDMAMLTSGDTHAVKRQDIKSWVNLGQAPMPEAEAPKSKKNVNLKLDPQPTSATDRVRYASPTKGSPRRLEDLDQKYVASIPVPQVAGLKPGDLPTDTHGYFHLNYPN